MKKEVWRKIDGYNWYQISSHGRVKSLYKNIIMKPRNHRSGYLSIFLQHLTVKRKKKGFLIHRLVAKAFVANPKERPCVNHIDGDKKNNNVKNLQWCNHKENAIHARDIGLTKRGQASSGAKLKEEDVIKIREMYKSGVTKAEIAKKYKITPGNCHFIISRRSWGHI